MKSLRPSSSKPDGLKIGLGQIALTMDDKAANVAAVRAMIARAAAEQCALLVLPECCLAGWTAKTARAAAEPIPGPFTRALATLARRHRMAICIGLEERAAGGVVHNSAIFLNETGQVVLHYRKINELEMARKIYQPGARLEVAEWRGWKIGLSICADSWRPEITDALALMGAQLILSPSAWAVEPGGESTNLAWITECYRQRTAQRDVAILAPNSVGSVSTGPWRGRRLQGNSLIVGPGGLVAGCGATHQPELLLWHTPTPA